MTSLVIEVSASVQALVEFQEVSQLPLDEIRQAVDGFHERGKVLP